jgi:uracil-DNA glycosylase
MNKLESYFGSWYEKLSPFLNSPSFKTILTSLKTSENVTPFFNLAFKAFELCPFDKLKVVILTNNSYEKGMLGMAFTGYGKYPIDEKVLGDLLWKTEQDRFDKFINWAKQGVLLLNTDLTSIKGQTKVHIKLWEPFIEYLMTMLRTERPGTIYVLAGDVAQSWRPYINLKENDIIPVEHPMVAFAKKRPWVHGDMFNYINRVSNLINDKKINW